MAEQIKIFPCLFKLNSKNTISKWQIVIEKEGENYMLKTSFGLAQEGSKQQVHTTIIEKGKANRNTLQQANLEATSKWNEKTKRDTFTEMIPVSTNTTGIRPVVRPMLANSFDKELYETGNKSRAFKLSFPVCVQRKFDGIRCLSSQEDTNIVMESRKGVAFQNFNEIRKEVKFILEQYPNVYLDGELFTPDLSFETISGLVRLQTKNASKEQLATIEQIEYHIYDVYDPNNVLWSFNERKDFLSALKTRYSLVTKIVFVETEIADNMAEVKQKHDLYVQEGFEGLILRDGSGPYEQNKRSKYLQKYKEFMEEEFLITGSHDGEGHDKGMVIWECVTSTGKTFSAKPQGSFEERKRMFLIASTCIGKQLTVVFQEYSTDGIPRFPVGKGIRDGF
jgi:ATP-dependent DNA ligase